MNACFFFVEIGSVSRGHLLCSPEPFYVRNLGVDLSSRFSVSSANFEQICVLYLFFIVFYF